MAILFTTNTPRTEIKDINDYLTSCRRGYYAQSSKAIIPLKIATNVLQIDRTFNILIIITYEQRHRGDNIAASGASYLSVARLTRV